MRLKALNLVAFISAMVTRLTRFGDSIILRMEDGDSASRRLAPLTLRRIRAKQRPPIANLGWALIHAAA
jgi:hypothetical protein